MTPDVIELIEERRRSLGWTITMLAEEAGVHRTFLNRLRDRSSPPPRIRDRRFARQDPRYKKILEVLGFNEDQIRHLLGQIEELQKGHRRPRSSSHRNLLALHWWDIRRNLSSEQQARLYPVLYALHRRQSKKPAPELLTELAEVLSAQVADSPQLLGLLNLVYRSMGKPEE